MGGRKGEKYEEEKNAGIVFPFLTNYLFVIAGIYNLFDVMPR